MRAIDGRFCAELYSLRGGQGDVNLPSFTDDPPGRLAAVTGWVNQRCRAYIAQLEPNEARVVIILWKDPWRPRYRVAHLVYVEEDGIHIRPARD